MKLVGFLVESLKEHCYQPLASRTATTSVTGTISLNQDSRAGAVTSPTRQTNNRTPTNSDYGVYTSPDLEAQLLGNFNDHWTMHKSGQN
jgi:hypothetical protein